MEYSSPEANDPATITSHRVHLKQFMRSCRRASRYLFHDPPPETVPVELRYRNEKSSKSSEPDIEPVHQASSLTHDTFHDVEPLTKLSREDDGKKIWVNYSF